MSDRSFVSPAFRARVRTIAIPLALILGKLGLTPNALTIVGFLGTCAAGIAAAAQAWTMAGILVIAFGIFDLFDGALARATGTTSKFGAFLDSTLDRTGENVVLAGVAFGCAAAGFSAGVGLAALAMAFASVVTYARAKAEVVGLHGEVGVAPRPERLVLLAAGLVAAGLTGGVAGGSPWLAGALGLIALLSAITVIQRILHVRAQLGRSNT
jgi:CDP-diacylglycerol---glycerol-3-phosphate 3-phosphatidyltransferase